MKIGVKKKHAWAVTPQLQDVEPSTWQECFQNFIKYMLESYGSQRIKLYSSFLELFYLDR
jgi:hypothetical protein